MIFSFVINYCLIQFISIINRSTLQNQSIIRKNDFSLPVMKFYLDHFEYFRTIIPFQSTYPPRSEVKPESSEKLPETSGSDCLMIAIRSVLQLTVRWFRSIYGSKESTAIYGVGQLISLLLMESVPDQNDILFRPDHDLKSGCDQILDPVMGARVYNEQEQPIMTSSNLQQVMTITQLQQVITSNKDQPPFLCVTISSIRLRTPK